MPTAHTFIVGCDNPALCSFFWEYGVRVREGKDQAHNCGIYGYSKPTEETLHHSV